MSTGGEQLERTRLAILDYVHRKELRKKGLQAEDLGAQFEPGEPPPRTRRRRSGPDWLEHARDIVEDWWRYHPAHMAVDLARPALASYARRKPMQFLGIAAATGAVLVLLRPWKLISATGVLVALAKSPQVASLVMSAMASSHNPRGDEADEE
ncbi:MULTISPECIES: hypothetical protein [Ramlibacter]|uniref:Uncharacterized protein n=1 Tax=Ramlibacter pinisoli TaxID=2682844 RepID=A0A6N8IRQ6_9BURK|nr:MULTISPECIES: hypothetical protein [Ramlibacter]MBA2964606.1 hypothetical protein [Ramlibacter sp. CGMCC 1.13660]MVQ29571.1 hypothetical protein [Ramlibacter pinisoli]